VWTQAAEGKGILDPGDVEEGLAAAWLVGDSNFSSSDHHGTPEERMQAFWTGYQSDQPSDCDTYLA
jgi:predicted metalloprotease